MDKTVSSFVQGISYDKESKTLTVDLGEHGVYEHYNFPEHKFEEFNSAKSLGSYYITNVKYKYDYNKLDGKNA